MLPSRKKPKKRSIGRVMSKARPEMAGLERDYPDRAAKPIDNPYGPFADAFPLEQHRFGPFQPIAAFYESQKRR